jgi:hypothetical protein
MKKIGLFIVLGVLLMPIVFLDGRMGGALIGGLIGLWAALFFLALISVWRAEQRKRARTSAWHTFTVDRSWWASRVATLTSDGSVMIDRAKKMVAFNLNPNYTPICVPGREIKGVRRVGKEQIEVTLKGDATYMTLYAESHDVDRIFHEIEMLRAA